MSKTETMEAMATVPVSSAEIVNTTEVVPMTEVANSVETPVSAVEAHTESITDKGSERFAKLSQSISNSTAKVKGWIGSGANAIGRMFKKTAVGVLSAPEVLDKGVMAVKAGAESVKSGVVAGAELVGTKIDQGSQYVFDKADALDAWKDKKAEELKAWQEKTGAEIGAWTSEKVVATKEFITTKKEQVQQFSTEMPVLIGVIASLAKNRTVEGLRAAKEAVSTRWQKLVEFAKNAPAAAYYKQVVAEETMLAKLNEGKIKLIQEEMAKSEERRIKYAEKYAKMQGKSNQRNMVGQIQLNPQLAIAA